MSKEKSLPLQLVSLGHMIDELSDESVRSAFQKFWHKQAVKHSCRYLKSLTKEAV